MSTASVTAAVEPQAPARRRSAHPVPVFPIAILGIFALAAIFAQFFPIDPQAADLAARYRPPAWLEGGTLEHLLGTDHMGRDVLARLVYGGRISLTVGLAAVAVAGVLGTLIGIVAGYLGGIFDQVIMRIIDAWMALPSITIAIFLAAIVGPSYVNIILILAGVYWTRYARVVRGEVLSLRERDFVKLAVVAGCSPPSIMLRHILPNVANTAVVIATLMLGVVVVAEASLSFLGVGVPPPEPAWGQMLSDGKRGLTSGYWWVTVFPGLCIVLLVLSANLIGDWFRVRFDPQLRQL
ncbi:ABC transporter permease [Ramlibacter sp.]|uniref:ABC transporter permease n=1 Tax=Ramlibacter sp. TaxID=1917967 RepID=UPI003D14F25B